MPAVFGSKRSFFITAEKFDIDTCFTIPVIYVSPFSPPHICLLSLCFFASSSLKCNQVVMRQACIYIYICACCEVLIWSKFGGFKGYYLVQVGVIIWSKFLFWPFLLWFKPFFAHSVIILCFLYPIICNFLKIGFPKKGAKSVFFKCLCFTINF